MVKHRAQDKTAKYTLCAALLGILKMYSPILPFVTEEQRLIEQLLIEIQKVWKEDKQYLSSIKNDEIKYKLIGMFG